MQHIAASPAAVSQQQFGVPVNLVDEMLPGANTLLASGPYTAVATLAACLLISNVLGERVSSGLNGAWIPLAIVAMLLRAGPWLLARASMLEVTAANAKRVVRCCVVGSVLCAFSVIVLPLLLWHQLSATEQSIAFGFSCALLAVGAQVMVVIPGVSTGWVLTVAAVPFARALSLVQTNTFWPALTIVCYVVVLIVAARQFSKSYRELATTRAQAAHHAAMVEMLLHDFGEEARDWLWETDEQGKISYASVRMAEALDTQTEALVGRMFVDAVGNNQPQDAGFPSPIEQRDEFTERLKRKRPFRNQVLEYFSRGQRRWVSISAKPLTHEDGSLRGWRGTGIDVTQEFLRQREMERLATIDSLTGLANRFVLMQTLDQLLSGISEQRSCALLLLDLDDFKLINDHFGHPTGDRVLQIVAERLQAHVRSGQVLARLGGDEFALVVNGDVPRARLMELSERLLNSVSEPYDIDGDSMSVRCSIGVAIAGDDALDAKSLLKCADLALYAAKGAGRNGVRFFGYDMYRRIEDRYTLLEELRRGLDRDEFELVYQPLVRTHDSVLMGLEALVRWNHPQRGMLYPDEFIPVAEENGLISRIGTWVIHNACAQAARWPNPVRVSINVSPTQFSKTQLISCVDEALESSGLAAHRLELEITESAFFADGSGARRTMELLRERGVQISLDDFGSGHASLNHLRSFPINRLKIDRSFTATVADTTREGNESRSIVRAAIELARAMDLESTAEGVETKAQYDILRGMYCDEVQGYHIAYPMTQPALAAYFEKNQPQEAARSVA